MNKQMKGIVEMNEHMKGIIAMMVAFALVTVFVFAYTFFEQKRRNDTGNLALVRGQIVTFTVPNYHFRVGETITCQVLSVKKNRKKAVIECSKLPIPPITPPATATDVPEVPNTPYPSPEIPTDYPQPEMRTRP